MDATVKYVWFIQKQINQVNSGRRNYSVALFFDLKKISKPPKKKKKKKKQKKKKKNYFLFFPCY